jgi:hypothetical protein
MMEQEIPRPTSGHPRLGMTNMDVIKSLWSMVDGRWSVVDNNERPANLNV